MSDDHQSLTYLEAILLQAMNIMNSPVGFLYLYDNDRQYINLEIALPDTQQASPGLAQQAINTLQTVRQASSDGQHYAVYLPLTIYNSLTLGAVGFQLAAQGYDQREEMLLQLMADQAAVILINNRLLNQQANQEAITRAEHDQLLRIYEAIPFLEEDHTLDEYIQHVAKTYYLLGWPAIRIELTNSRTSPYLFNPDHLQIPDVASDSWKKDTLATALQWGNASIILDAHGWDILTISIRQPDNELVAILELLQPSQQRRITSENIRPFMLFARHFSNAIERHRLIHSLRDTANQLSEQVDELEFMRKADRELSSRLDPDRIAQFALDWAMRRTAADAGAILANDINAHRLLVKEAVGYPASSIQTLNQLDPASGIIGRCLKSRSRQVIDPVQQDPDYITLLPETQNLLVVPLLSNKRIVGAINLESHIPGRFDDYSVQFVERIASMTAIALDNAQLLQQAEQLADDMSIIYNAGRTISSSLEWEKTIQSIAQGMALAVKGSNALIYAYTASSQSAKLLSIYTTDEQSHTLPNLNSTLDVSKYSELQKAIETSRLLIIDPASPDSRLKQWINEMEYSIAGIAPLTAQGEVVGLAILLRTQASAYFAPSEIFVAESLATQAAAVLRQASLYSNILELETLKSEMIRMASHDLRAPIANAKGFMELLEMDMEGLLSDDLQSYLDSIRRSLTNMETLVEDLLTLEKVESQRSDSWERFDLHLLVQEVIFQLEGNARLNQQSLIPQLAPAPYPVRASQTQLRQAITNLIGNGLKYTPQGGTIIVAARVENKRLYCDVQDNGYGIPKERQNRIFQRFYRAKTPGTDHISGSGLGLSLVKAIIERHAGEIWFVSEEGVGSTFSFWLPLYED
jgi:signal transduction histidine kinase